jgi:hypothetical protein
MNLSRGDVSNWTGGDEGNEMPTEHTDLTVFAKDYPEARLVLEVKPAVSTPAEQDVAVRQLAQYMWGANCHYGLVMTPTLTYVLRDNFSAAGPEAMRVTDVLPTATLLSRLNWSGTEPTSGQELELLAREWLQRLTTSYQAALPDDPDVMRALFPDLVGAVAEGRVVAEVAAR